MTVRRFLHWFTAGMGASLLLMVAVLAWWTRDARVAAAGLLLAGLMAGWMALFLYVFGEKLRRFTDALCHMLDEMIDGRAQPSIDLSEETLLSRIAHRLERLYGVLAADRKRLDAERTALQSLVSDISHQTKTPIANLKMLNETLLARPLDEVERRTFLSASADELEKLDFLIQALVKTSRLETGLITLEKVMAPVDDTLAQALNGVLAILEQKGLDLEVECPAGIVVCHDRRWTAEALFNLLDNAVKYTPVGGHIRVRVQEWEAHVKIDVSDDGPAIPEALQGAIFQRFVRAPEVHDVPGIGLGLYLAREIITLQGGYMQLSSAPGAGVTFSVYLPKLACPDASSKNSERSDFDG